MSVRRTGRQIHGDAAGGGLPGRAPREDGDDDEGDELGVGAG